MKFNIWLFVCHLLIFDGSDAGATCVVAEEEAGDERAGSARWQKKYEGDDAGSKQTSLFPIASPLTE